VTAYRVDWQDDQGSWHRSCVFETPDQAMVCVSARPSIDGTEFRVVQVNDDDFNPRANRWFGEPWPYTYLPAPVCEDYRLHTDTPTGEDCLSCDEPILPSESGTVTPFLDLDGVRLTYQHAECMLRSVMCPIEMGLVDDPAGTHEHDPDRRREEAKLIMEWARSRQPV
jgi:hypothetical protein